MRPRKLLRPWNTRMKTTLCTLSIICLSLSCTAAPDANTPAFATRGWVLLDYTMPYLREMIPLAAEEGINHIQFCHTIGMNLSDYLEPQRNEHIRELIELAHQHGIKAYAWTHELDDVPERFMQGGKVAAHGDEFWEWMGERYETLLSALPDIDGVVVTLTETRVPIDDDNLVRSPLSPSERLVRMSQTIHGVLHPAGKELILRTFTWIEEDYDWMLDAFEQLPDDVIIMSKVNWGDWYQHFPRNPFIGKVAPHRQYVEFDLTGQYHGDTLTPWVCAEFLQEEMQYALTQNAAGIIGRVEWSGRAYGSANELNAVAFSGLAHDVGLDLNRFSLEWAREKYGAEAAPHVISALGRTNEIANLLYFTLGFKAFQYSGALKGLSHMDGTRIMHSLFCRDVQARWKPELIPIAEELMQPTESTMHKAIAEKERAVVLADACLKDLDRARPHLTGEDYHYLTGLFRNARLIARSWRWIHEAYFHYLFLRNGDHSQEAPLQRSLGRILELADEVEHRFGDRIYLLQPETMREFVSDIRILMHPPVKWFASTNLESGRAPLLFDLDDDGVSEIIVNGRDNAVHAFTPRRTEVWRHETSGLRVYYPHISDPVPCNFGGHPGFAIGAADGCLYVFRADGSLRWKYMTGNAIVAAPVQLHGSSDSVVTACASLDGHLYGLSTDGELLWKRETGGIVDTNPVVGGDGRSLVVVSTRSGILRAFDGRGEPAWSREMPGPLTGAIARHTIDGRELISVGTGQTLNLVDWDGNPLAPITVPQECGRICVAANTAVIGDREVLVLGTDKGYLVACDLGGQIAFKPRLGEEIRTPAVVQSSEVFLAGVDNRVVAVNGKGREIWHFTATSDGSIGTQLVLNPESDELVFTAMDRKLYVIDTKEIAGE